MIKYEYIIQEIVKNISQFTFKSNFAEMKNKMKLVKIHKDVHWELTEDLYTPQIKKYIKQQLTNNNELDLSELKKSLINEELKNKQIDGYLDEMPIKTSNLIEQGTFYIQANCSSEQAYKLINETINELQMEKEKMPQKVNQYDNRQYHIQTGNNSPVIIGEKNNVVQSYNDKENILANELQKQGITKEQVDELIKILREEEQNTENRILGTKTRNWFNNTKTIGLNILSNLIFSIMYGLPPV